MPVEQRTDYKVVEVTEDVWLCDRCDREIGEPDTGYTFQLWEGRSRTMRKAGEGWHASEYLCEDCAKTPAARRISMRHLRERPLLALELEWDGGIESVAGLFALAGFVVAYSIIAPGVDGIGEILLAVGLTSMFSILFGMLMGIVYDVWRGP